MRNLGGVVRGGASLHRLAWLHMGGASLHMGGASLNMGWILDQKLLLINCLLLQQPCVQHCPILNMDTLTRMAMVLATLLYTAVTEATLRQARWSGHVCRTDNGPASHQPANVRKHLEKWDTNEE